MMNGGMRQPAYRGLPQSIRISTQQKSCSYLRYELSAQPPAARLQVHQLVRHDKCLHDASLQTEAGRCHTQP